MKVLTIFSFLISTLLFVSCDETKKVIDVAGSVQLSGTYDIATVNGSAVNANGMSLTMAALDKSIRGTTGCNSFFGNYTLDLYAIQFGDLAVSEKMCDKVVMSTERALLDALKETGSYTMQEGELTLYSKADRGVLLVAKKQKTSGN
ncbi:META domain-containing protein [Ulvibacter antarcticus]|uniref:Heat shock protein HslJ n=1 Tax=Ulvibacter antarcticus TaxID=442714 RepID=A0A3L9YYM7_9FLAO|nr:META domain-containing protein [Ulvibacter antarcticus]RMA65831.1 heat shock protein HslJ [Ulvibacter antarcticus]